MSRCRLNERFTLKGVYDGVSRYVRVKQSILAGAPRHAYAMGRGETKVKRETMVIALYACR
jgi:hypothetical protein